MYVDKIVCLQVTAPPALLFFFFFKKKKERKEGVGASRRRIPTRRRPEGPPPPPYPRRRSMPRPRTTPIRQGPGSKGGVQLRDEHHRSTPPPLAMTLQFLGLQHWSCRDQPLLDPLNKLLASNSSLLSPAVNDDRIRVLRPVTCDATKVRPALE
jgi:hypothetical protein